MEGANSDSQGRGQGPSVKQKGGRCVCPGFGCGFAWPSDSRPKAFQCWWAQELGMVTKTLPPLLSSGNYSLKKLSLAILVRHIQEGPHESLGDTRATMGLFQWGRHWILPEVVSKFFFFLNHFFFFFLFLILHLLVL